MLHRLFDIGVLLKRIDGILETVGGFLFLFTNRTTMNRIVIALTQHELLEDPDDWIANSLRQALSHLSASGKLFGGIYLLVHGPLKIFLLVSLLYNKLWAFPLAIAILIAFIGYQIYRVSLYLSWSLVFLSVFDIAVVLLIWHEYRYVKRRTEQRRTNV